MKTCINDSGNRAERRHAPLYIVNGHIFSVLSTEWMLAFRLSEFEKEQLLKKQNDIVGIPRKNHEGIYQATRCLFKKTNEVKKHLEVSLKYVKTLKAKKK